MPSPSLQRLHLDNTPSASRNSAQVRVRACIQPARRRPTLLARAPSTRHVEPKTAPTFQGTFQSRSRLCASWHIASFISNGFRWPSVERHTTLAPPRASSPQSATMTKLTFSALSKTHKTEVQRARGGAAAQLLSRHRAPRGCPNLLLRVWCRLARSRGDSAASAACVRRNVLLARG